MTLPIENVKEQGQKARNLALAALILAGMLLAGTVQWASHSHAAAQSILLLAICASYLPLLVDLIRQLRKRNFSVDLLAATSIVSAIFLRQYWVAAIVVLMLSGGRALEEFATRHASSVLGALARRMPNVAHKVLADGTTRNITTDTIAVGDILQVHPHELCPVDGIVIGGNGTMDESYLTGEPFLLSKAPGAVVLSGAINGDGALTIKATRLVADSRYAKITAVLENSEKNRPQMRRIGDRLGAWYTPISLGVAVASWALTGDPERFLAVVVIATPCPLLLAIPVAIIGAISVSARRGIVVKDPGILEEIGTCDMLVVDKTGTLTYGKPSLDALTAFGTWPRAIVLQLAATAEQYSKHPLAAAVLSAAKREGLQFSKTRDIFEIPGNGLTAHIDGYLVTLTGRHKLPPRLAAQLPSASEGLECVVLIDGELAGHLRFRDAPRPESKPFLGHLKARHGIRSIVLLSGDRVSEVNTFAQRMGISDMHGAKSPEEKVEIVSELTKQHRTLFVGDGINDAPAMLNATVGVALGVNSDITSEAAGAVILQSSLSSIDELIHIGSTMRQVALTSAIGGIALSGLGMGASALGFLKPIEGAILQEVIDLVSILYALRIVLPNAAVGDFSTNLPAESSDQAQSKIPWTVRNLLHRHATVERH